MDHPAIENICCRDHSEFGQADGERRKQLEDSAAACAVPMHGYLSTPLVVGIRPKAPDLRNDKTTRSRDRSIAIRPRETTHVTDYYSQSIAGRSYSKFKALPISSPEIYSLRAILHIERHKTPLDTGLLIWSAAMERRGPHG